MESQTSELGELKSAFEDWRRSRGHSHEAVPETLLERAQRAVGVYGLAEVYEATKFDRSRLQGRPGRTRRKVTVPAFSRVRVAPGAVSQPLVELELPTGARLRAFTQAPEVLHLVAALCSPGETQ